MRTALVFVPIAGLLVLGAMAVPAAAPFAVGRAAAPAHCRNYEVGTKYGKVRVDTRTVGADPAGQLTWHWYIYDVTHIAGPYSWRIQINGTPWGGARNAARNDNLRFTIPRVDNGRPVYKPGDEIHVQAKHVSYDGTVYLATLNRCRIP